MCVNIYCFFGIIWYPMKECTSWQFAATDDCCEVTHLKKLCIHEFCLHEFRFYPNFSMPCGNPVQTKSSPSELQIRRNARRAGFALSVKYIVKDNTSTCQVPGKTYHSYQEFPRSTSPWPSPHSSPTPNSVIRTLPSIYGFKMAYIFAPLPQSSRHNPEVRENWAPHPPPPPFPTPFPGPRETRGGCLLRHLV